MTKRTPRSRHTSALDAGCPPAGLERLHPPHGLTRSRSEHYCAIGCRGSGARPSNAMPSGAPPDRAAPAWAAPDTVCADYAPERLGAALQPVASHRTSQSVCPTAHLDEQSSARLMRGLVIGRIRL